MTWPDSCEPDWLDPDWPTRIGTGRCLCLPPDREARAAGSACPVHGWVPAGHGTGCGCLACVNTRLRAQLAWYMQAELLQQHEDAVIRSMGIPPPVTRVIERATTVVYQQPAPVREPAPEPKRNTALVLPVCGMIFVLAVISQILFWFH